MFARLMRHPAGLMQKVFRKTFARREEMHAEASATRSWHARFSNFHWSLEAPEAQSQLSAPADPPAGWGEPAFSRHLLARHFGRAASFLVPRPPQAETPKH